jgi:site-specific recombinase
VETILSSLNYGLGFVLIHLLGFTIATKQPAMTASTFAKAIEKGEKSRANQKKLVALMIQVNRSQFAAVAGNVIFALLVAFGISYVVMGRGAAILSPEETAYYLLGLEPYPALFYAAIAGIWLFFSGLIAGYFDNRANLLELKERYFHHPLLKKLIREKRREKLACFLHEHHGAMAGNFFFGLLLGITPYLGYLLDLPLDIRHVAFSTAYLGYSSMHIDISLGEFLMLFLFVLLIGLVNLSVSFILALKVSLLSRDSYFGNFFSFVKLFAIEVGKRPLELFLPPPTKEEEREETER